MLVLSEDCSKSFHLLLALLDEITVRDSLQLGGASVLEARWQHRSVNDVALFVSTKHMVELVDSFIEKVSEENWIDRGIKIEQIFGVSGVLGYTPHGQFSIFGSPNVFKTARSDEDVEGSGVFAQRTAEILIRKIRARMIRTSHYYSRDAYDIVVASLYVPEEFKLVLDKLTPVEINALKFDQQRDDVYIKDLEELIQPAFPQIVENLQSYLFDVLTQRTSREDLLRILNLDLHFPE